MALFAVTRYMGEDDSVETDDKHDQVASILERLKSEAKSRQQQRLPSPKSSQNLSAVHGSESASKNEKPQKKKRKGSLNIDSNQSVTEESLSVTLKEDSDENEQVSIDAKQKKKSQKKHKHKLSETSESGAVDTSETDTPVTGARASEASPRKRRKTKQTESASGTISESDIEALSQTPTRKKRKNNLSGGSGAGEDGSSGSGEEEEEQEQDEEDDNRPARIAGGPNEIGGFTVLGDIKPKHVEKVRRVLPDWLAQPSVVESDLKLQRMAVTDMPGLEADLVEKLQQNNITYFFPVQMHVIPILLESTQTGFHQGRAGYRPSDICVSAPTGSGKTLAFALPVVQALRKRVTCQVRALVVLPVRDLAKQVFKVFQTYCQGTKLRVGLLIGQKTFHSEQQTLVSKRLRGYQSMVDIVVATPGRLVDHLNKTPGFSLRSLRFLVIDEADRMIEEIKQDWLSLVESAVYSPSRPSPGPLTASSCSALHLPLQKLLYSATLSQNPEKLQQLNLFQPKLFTSVVKASQKPAVKKQTPMETEAPAGGSTVAMDDQKEFVGKYITPSGLTEYYIKCQAPQKPLIILHLLHHLNFRQILCFTNSVESTHRLYWLVKLMGRGVEAREFSSELHTAQRDKIIHQFEAGKIDIIICSDAMARGIDMENVKYVVSYDPPQYIKTYIHRIGRTARAGKTGSAVTLLQDKEFYHFKKMVKEAGKRPIQAMDVTKAGLKPLVTDYKEALEKLPDVLKAQKKKGH